MTMVEYFKKHYNSDVAHQIAGRIPEPTFTLEEVLQELHQGRTSVNFGHVPEVSRALDWLSTDFRAALERGE